MTVLRIIGYGKYDFDVTVRCDNGRSLAQFKELCEIFA